MRLMEKSFEERIVLIVSNVAQMIGMDSYRSKMKIELGLS